MSSTEKFVSIDDKIKQDNLIKCYQIQANSEGTSASPVYIGSYQTIPLQIYDTLRLNKQVDGKTTEKIQVHIVSYVLPEDVIQNNDLYNMVGLVLQKNDNEESQASLDLVYNKSKKQFQIIYYDHNTQNNSVYKDLDKFPGQDKIIEKLINDMFDSPLKYHLSVS